MLDAVPAICLRIILHTFFLLCPGPVFNRSAGPVVVHTETCAVAAGLTVSQEGSRIYSLPHLGIFSSSVPTLSSYIGGQGIFCWFHFSYQGILSSLSQIWYHTILVYRFTWCYVSGSARIHIILPDPYLAPERYFRLVFARENA
jgi:hypothetical protein